MSTDFDKYLRDFTLKALEEDVREGDHTTLSTIPKHAEGKAHFLIKEKGIIAGLEVVGKMLRIIDPTTEVEQLVDDGKEVGVGDVVMRISGSIHSILKSERLVLNVLQRMSGVASKTYQYVSLIRDTETKVLDTRKTTPLLRSLEKEAVRIGGGVNHRYGLYDMILIKDNHVDYAGGIKKALEQTYKYLRDNAIDIPVEIEVRNFEELSEVIEFGRIDRIMLDNFSPQEVSKAVNLIDTRFITEASGGITLDTIRDYALAGVDFISVGDLTHSVKSMDISLKAL